MLYYERERPFITMINLNQNHHLKSFLYCFFIIWNFFIIILLVLLNLYILPFHLVRPERTAARQEARLQIKPEWESISQFQNMDTNVFFLATLEKGRDKTGNAVCLSREGNIFILDGKNGKILSRISMGTSSSRVSVLGDRILAGNRSGKLRLFHSSGALLRELVLTNAPVLDILGNAVMNRTGLYLVDPSELKIRAQFTSFSNELAGTLLAGRLNGDKTDDYIVCEKNYLHCFDGLVLKELWQKSVPFIHAGRAALIRDKENDPYILLPLYSGVIRIFNRNGIDVHGIKIGENLVSAPLVLSGKKSVFVQPTLENNLYAFDFIRKKNIWSLRLEERIADLAEADTDQDGTGEVFALTETGRLYVIDSRDGTVLLDPELLQSGQGKVSSSLLVRPGRAGGNWELLFSTDRGNVYKYSCFALNKKWKLKNLLKLVK